MYLNSTCLNITLSSFLCHFNVNTQPVSKFWLYLHELSISLRSSN